jgi:hypothetical protein
MLELKTDMTDLFLKESTVSTWEFVANTNQNSLLIKIELGCMRSLIHIM